jgi:hypothetical protein
MCRSREKQPLSTIALGLILTPAFQPFRRFLLTMVSLRVRFRCSLSLAPTLTSFRLEAAMVFPQLRFWRLLGSP